MKVINQKRLLVVIVIILLLFVSSVIIFKPFRSAGQKRYDACLKEPQDIRPNGCAPPGYCDAINDGYVKCDE